MNVKLNLIDRNVFTERMVREWTLPFECKDSFQDMAYKMYKYSVLLNNGEINPPPEEYIDGDVEIPFNNTTVTVKCDTNGVRAIKTIYRTKEEFLNIEDLCVPKLLNQREEGGKFELQEFIKSATEEEHNLLYTSLGYYYFLDQIYDHLEELSIDEVLDNSIVSNAELRALLLQQPHISSGLYSKLKKVDTYVNPRDNGVYNLYKGKLKDFFSRAEDDDEIAYVQCWCPSSDRVFMLGVNPSNNNAKDAVASLIKLPSDLLKHVKSIARQGEVFAVTYNCDTNTEEFKKHLESELVPLSGDYYFEKLVFES